ncbi:hypothetical protein ACQ4PT_037970 [Festuca glaucescens]
MAEGGRMNQIGKGGTSSAAITTEELQALRPSVLLPPATKGRVTGRRPRAPTPSQAEEGHATARKESVEQCRKAKVKRHIELGGIVTVFGFAVLSGLFCLPEEAKRLNSVRFLFSMLLAFATFLSGMALTLFSVQMLGLQDNLVSGGRRVVSKSLIGVCTVLPAMTLVSLLALLPSTLYFCLSLAVITVVVLPVVAAYCYLWRRAEGGDEAAAYEEHKEALEAASKITSCVTSSAFGGLVGVLFSASKSKQGFDATAAVYAAIFFMFSTAILGMLVMTVSKKVTKVTNRRHRLFLVSAISLANALLLCSLASAASAASFAVIGCQSFASFAPLAITGVIYLTLQSCHGRGDARNQENEEARLKATEDVASKVVAVTMGAIMTVLAVSVGENGHAKTGATYLFMAVLTSTFVSSFGLMLLAAMPSSAKLCLAPISKLLVWSSVATFAAAAVSVYGAEVFRAASQ